MTGPINCWADTRFLALAGIVNEHRAWLSLVGLFKIQSSKCGVIVRHGTRELTSGLFGLCSL